ncbi:hypothetical protein BU25DRAFT_491539 [Macroventuria anomochaeta]|uniref:Uncharacterized protein n=1 Tax=Macroventuria anomochaeta TaxID=301207 RepID=A0ACB6S0H4_9PLEO|nr:uncharacterized protein BU25DRAFT_491539 [Macroventuria anomochaeta]KAF2627012.1 hypothetical protein BU25DRAFT_491539 [Macroventuria anomochaeta]
MLIQDEPNEKKIEFTPRGTSKQAPNLDGLRQILHLRGRLQEMGTTFTAEGEMQTYGNPPLNADLEQMLRLGSIYDEQWNMFFDGSNAPEVESNLWPDLKVLKNMLQNDGVLFDDQHKRLNYGTSHPKLIRLSDQYDLLREEWIEKTIRDIHPAERPQRPCPTREEVPKAPTNLGWSFLLDNDGEDELIRKKSLRSSRLTVTVDEQLSIRNGTAPTVQDAYTALSSPPITPESSTNARGITPILAFDTTALTRPRGPTIGASTLLHGPSPLQAAETARMLLRDAASETRTISTMSEVDAVKRYHEQNQHEHAGVLAPLVEDERRRAEERQRAEEPVVREGKKKTKKSKGVRKWLRAVLGRRKEGEQ